MSRNKKFKNGKDKREGGGFSPLPHAISKSQSFKTLDPYETKLLIDLLSQYRGKNNGDLCMAWTIMQERGWKSQATLNKRKESLIEKGWIVKTRQGGKHKPSLYALTFFAIDECKGKLDVKATGSPSSEWKKYEAKLLESRGEN